MSRRNVRSLDPNEQRGDVMLPLRPPLAVSDHPTARLSINLHSMRANDFTVVSRPAFASLPLYSPEERARRDASPWTIVQGVLAPVQFAIFLVSLALVARYLVTGEGLAVATASIVVKTIALYAIMITGSIWEREVFGVWLFARPFFWEDAFSFIVIGLHTAYLFALVSGADPHHQMMIALAAYATYVVNAGQFLLKLRMARRQSMLSSTGVAKLPNLTYGRAVR